MTPPPSWCGGRSGALAADGAAAKEPKKEKVETSGRLSERRQRPAGRMRCTRGKENLTKTNHSKISMKSTLDKREDDSPKRPKTT